MSVPTPITPPRESASWREVLVYEFSGEEGSFLLELRLGTWDIQAFARLIVAMRKCAETYESNYDVGSSETVERWIADGFWFVHQCSTVDLSDLVSWFFSGHFPYTIRIAIEKQETYLLCYPNEEQTVQLSLGEL